MPLPLLLNSQEHGPGSPSAESTALPIVPLPALINSSAVVMSPEPVFPLEESSPSPPDSSESGYFLRSCQKQSYGLGKSSSPVRRGRGRKTNLSKAQSRAKEDLLGGKQLSIEKALRAESAKKKGR